MRIQAMVAGFALLALACAAPQSAPTTGGIDGSGSPQAGGTLRMRLGGDLFDFDMSYSAKGGGMSDVTLLYESLLGFKAGDVDYLDRVIVPELAERWEVSPDARTYTFFLRKGARFHDLPPVNGRELTAADVHWTFEYWSRTGQFRDRKLPQGQFDWMFEGLERIETPDPYTVVIRFKEPFAPFLNYAAHDYNPIVAREVYDLDGHLKDRVVGTGAFYLDTPASQKGTRVVLKKHPGYWDSPRPYLDEVHALVVQDTGSARAAFQTKQLDWMGPGLNARMGQEITKMMPQVVSYRYTRGAPVHIYMNNKKEPLNNRLVRKAISRAIDPDEFIKVLGDGEGRWALAGAGPDLFSEEEVKQIVKHDPGEARRLLAEAGYPNGIDLPYEYPVDREGDYVKHMELFIAQMKRAGINVVPLGIAYADYSNRKKSHQHFMNMINKDLVADDDSYLYAIFHPKSKANYDEVDDPQLTPLLDAQRREPDPAKRREIMRQAARYINGEGFVGRAVYLEVEYEFWYPYVKGYAPNFNHPGWGALVNTWLDR